MIRARDVYFFLHTQSSPDDTKMLYEELNVQLHRHNLMKCVKLESRDGSLQIEIGVARARDKDLIRRLKKRRRESKVQSGVIEQNGQLKVIANVKSLDGDSLDRSLSKFFPCDLYVGSGLSYEAGVPVLADLHETFGVDDRKKGFLFGRDDPLVTRLVPDAAGTFLQLMKVDFGYMAASPSRGHKLIMDLQSSQAIRYVFTDNVDDLLERAHVTCVPTRGDGLCNVRYDFGSHRDRQGLMDARFPLLVVGVSADRRGIVQQARKAGRKIVIINPIKPVSPLSRNMDYLRSGDVLIRKEFRSVCDALERFLEDWRHPVGRGGGQR